MDRAGLTICDRGCVLVRLDVPDVNALADATGLRREARREEQAAAFRQSDGSYQFGAVLAYLVVD
jgi:cell envelope opacity-associated protein A